MTTAPANAPPWLKRIAGRFSPADMDLPQGRARIRLSADGHADWDAVVTRVGCEVERADGERPDATVSADAETWDRLAAEVRAGMAAFRSGKLQVRQNLHLGVGFLAATSGASEQERLRFGRLRTRNHDIAYLEAGEGEPLVCVHGLGGTKASFLPTVSALAPEGFRVVAIDLPGFGDSHKPRDGRYDAAWFADALVETLDQLEIERAHLVGNSMGGRIAIEAALTHADRVNRIVLLSPALAWLRDRGWKWLLRLPLPRLGYIQPTPRWAVEPVVRRIVPGASEGWTAAGVDEFLRSYLDPDGRYAFYESARNIYMDEPHGDDGFWTRLQRLSQDSLFVWGRQDSLVPSSFMRHVERVLPDATHLELDCGHVPQLELPGPTHRAIDEFLRA